VGVRDHSRPLKLVYLKAWVRFPIRLSYGSILSPFRDKARYWPKIAIFFTPLAFDGSLRGGVVSVGIVIPFGTEKLEWSGYPTVKKV